MLSVLFCCVNYLENWSFNLRVYINVCLCVCIDVCACVSAHIHIHTWASVCRGQRTTLSGIFQLSHIHHFGGTGRQVLSLAQNVTIRLCRWPWSLKDPCLGLQVHATTHSFFFFFSFYFVILVELMSLCLQDIPFTNCPCNKIFKFLFLFFWKDKSYMNKIKDLCSLHIARVYRSHPFVCL